MKGRGFFTKLTEKDSCPNWTLHRPRRVQDQNFMGKRPRSSMTHSGGKIVSQRKVEKNS